MEKVKLSAPWVTFAHEINALFENDPQVHVLYNDADNVLSIYVDNQAKADALMKLIPEEKVFGNVTMKINIIPANKEETKISLFETAFAGNPAVEQVYSAETPFGQMNYVIFKKEVVQFYNDQMDDINGNKSTLFQNIAEDVFDDHLGVYFCTSPI